MLNLINKLKNVQIVKHHIYVKQKIICHFCKGSGWIIDIKKSKNSSFIKLPIHSIHYKHCYKCNGAGLN